MWAVSPGAAADGSFGGGVGVVSTVSVVVGVGLIRRAGPFGDVSMHVFKAPGVGEVSSDVGDDSGGVVEAGIPGDEIAVLVGIVQYSGRETAECEVADGAVGKVGVG